MTIWNQSDTDQTDPYFARITAALQAGDGQAAREEAYAFSVAYPDSDRLPEALYRLAESYQNEEDFANGAAAFHDLVQSVPDSPWAPWSLLREGECRHSLGDVAGARAVWRSVQGRYQSSKAASEASARLSEAAAVTTPGLVAAPAATVHPAPLAGARASFDAGDYLKAIDVLASLTSPEAAALRNLAIAEWTRTEREAAYADFVETRWMPVGPARLAALTAARDRFAAINERFPDNRLTAEILDNIAKVNAEIEVAKGPQ